MKGILNAGIKCSEKKIEFSGNLDNLVWLKYNMFIRDREKKQVDKQEGQIQIVFYAGQGLWTLWCK